MYKVIATAWDDDPDDDFVLFSFDDEMDTPFGYSTDAEEPRPQPGPHYHWDGKTKPQGPRPPGGTMPPVTP